MDETDLDFDMSGLEINTSCNYEGVTDIERKQILIAKGLTGGVSFIACALSLVLFAVLYVQVRRGGDQTKDRVPLRSTERLMMYLIAASAIRSVVVMLQTTAVDYDETDPTDHGLCLFTGFLDQWTDWIILLNIQMILLHLFLQIFFKIGKTERNCYHYYQRRIEVIFVLFPVLFPLLFSWIPFIHDTYGLAGAWCWIRKEDSNCNEYQEGLIEQYALWFVWLFLFQIFDCIALLIGYPISITLKVKDYRERKSLVGHHAPALCLIGIYVVVYWISVVNRLHRIISPVESIHLWIFHAIGAASAGFLSGVAFTAYLVFRYNYYRECVKSLRNEKQVQEVVSKL